MTLDGSPAAVTGSAVATAEINTFKYRGKTYGGFALASANVLVSLTPRTSEIAAWGMLAGVTVGAELNLVTGTVIPLNAQISWRFPARLPEPTPENLADAAAIVSSLGADLGLAHDGDADRLVLINPAGRVLPDSIVSILALRASVQQGRVVVLSENTSSAVEEEATRMGCHVVRSRIGKSFVEIEKEGAAFATEPSKVVDPKWGMWEDGMYAAVLIADALAREPELLKLIGAEPKWQYKQVNIPVSVDLPRAAERIEAEFAKFRISEVRRLDGLKIVFKDGSWIMFRSSGTEPKTRIYCESVDPLRLEELLGTGKKVLEDVAGPGKVQW